jgi:antitoxin component YwqK of YwqJK toxin-antitoxin module
MVQFKFLIYPILLFALISCKSKPEVKIISIFSSGKVQEIYTYVNPSDTTSYIDTKYHDNGQILYHGEFVKDKKEGYWVWYSSNGILRDSATYHQNEFIGRRVHWDSLGHLIKLEIIEGPCSDCCCDGVVTNYYPNGKVQDQAHMYNGKHDGKYEYYYENGQPKKEEYFSADIKNGKYYEWYENSKPWVIGFYKKDKMDSTWTWFDSAGLVTSIQELRAGKLIKQIK